MISARRLAFVGHDATLTGAPVVLLNFLRWIRATSGEVPVVLLLGGGPLEVRYRAVAEVIRADRSWDRRADQLRSVCGGSGRVWSGRRLRAAVSATKASAVVANTLVAGRAVVEAGIDVPIVCHVHELDGVAERVLGDASLAVAAAMHGFVAAGDAVARMLVDRWHVAPERVRVVEEFVDRPLKVRPPGRRAVPLVVGVGTAKPRKGLTSFIDLLAILNRDGRVVDGCWVGAAPLASAELAAWIDAALPPGRIELVEPVDDPAALIVGADLLVSSSLEDPFPLVALEAGALGVPVVGFDSGGLHSLLERCRAADGLVPVDDVIGLAGVCRRLLDDAASRSSIGRRLQESVTSTNLTEQLAPDLWSAIGELLE